jgi:hypothetical protein
MIARRRAIDGGRMAIAARRHGTLDAPDFGDPVGQSPLSGRRFMTRGGVSRHSD